MVDQASSWGLAVERLLGCIDEANLLAACRPGDEVVDLFHEQRRLLHGGVLYGIELVRKVKGNREGDLHRAQ